MRYGLESSAARVLAVIVSSGIAVVLTAGGCSFKATNGASPTGVESSGLTSSINGCDPNAGTVPYVQENCPLNTCDPGRMNGKGVYALDEPGSTFCLKYDKDNNADGGVDWHFCPEAFRNTDAGVVLTGRVQEDGHKVLDLHIDAWKEGQPVVLERVHGAGNLTLQYHSLDSSESVVLSGNEVSKMTLGLYVKPPVPEGLPSLPTACSTLFELKFGEPAPHDAGVSQYTVTYSQAGSTSWTNYCQDGVGQASFLPQRRVHVRSAELWPDPTVTTMACSSGAIVSCMMWGYRPWETPANQSTQARDNVYGACLQAKRAAYFAQSGDYTNYTNNGTSIAVQDPYSIKTDTIENLEALWSRKGAECLNVDNRRNQALQFPDSGLPLCNGISWSDGGVLATGHIRQDPLPD